MSPETAHAIDQIQVNLNAGGMNTINIILAFVMFGVALGIKPGIFVEVFRKPIFHLSVGGPPLPPPILPSLLRALHPSFT